MHVKLGRENSLRLVYLTVTISETFGLAQGTSFHAHDYSMRGAACKLLFLFYLLPGKIAVKADYVSRQSVIPVV